MILSRQFERALKFAARRHKTQTRKGTAIPYVAHLLAVAAIVLEHGGNETEAIAALLHDTLEDGKAKEEELRDRFGDPVTDIVLSCSDTVAKKKPKWRPRKEAYLARIAGKSPSARLVSAADKLHNARAILRDYRALGEKLWTRFNASRDDIRWYYESMVKELRAAGDSALVDELALVVSDLRQEIERRGGRSRG